MLPQRMNVFVFLLPFLFACCNNSKHPAHSDVPTIRLTYDDDAVMDAARFVDSVQVVLLEGGEDACIGSVSKLDLVDSLFVVTDLNTQSVFIYSLNGQLKAKIAAHGRGPGEYVALYTTWIDREKKIVAIYDDHQTKILLYTLNGEFVKEYKSPSYIHGFALSQGHGYYYRSMDGFPNDKMQPSNYHLIMTSPDTLKLELYREFWYGNIESFPFQKFIVSNGNVLLLTPQEQYIYEMSGLEMKLKYRVELGPNPLWTDDNYLSIKTLKGFNDISNQCVGKLKNLNFMGGDRYLFFQFAKGKTEDVSDLACAIYDMQSGRVIESGRWFNNEDRFFMKHPQFFNDTLWVSSFFQHEIREGMLDEIGKKYHVDFSQSINPFLVVRKLRFNE